MYMYVQPNVLTVNETGHQLSHDVELVINSPIQSRDNFEDF